MGRNGESNENVPVWRFKAQLHVLSIYRLLFVLSREPLNHLQVQLCKLKFSFVTLFISIDSPFRYGHNPI